jgi:hypothetical protein
MTCYFYDLDVGAKVLTDDKGIELASDSEAIIHAIEVIRELTWARADETRRWRLITRRKPAVRFVLPFGLVERYDLGRFAQACCDMRTAVSSGGTLIEEIRATLERSNRILSGDFRK